MNSSGIAIAGAPPGAVVPGYQFVCELNARLESPIVIGATPAGLTRVVPITGGRVEGPLLRGTGLPGGADWQYERSDGVCVSVLVCASASNQPRSPGIAWAQGFPLRPYF